MSIMVARNKRLNWKVITSTFYTFVIIFDKIVMEIILFE